jgi:hypothetical protein
MKNILWSCYDNGVKSYFPWWEIKIIYTSRMREPDSFFYNSCFRIIVLRKKELKDDTPFIV